MEMLLGAQFLKKVTVNKIISEQSNGNFMQESVTMIFINDCAYKGFRITKV